MYSSVRRYTTSPEDAEAIVELIKQGNIEQRIGVLPGFVAYYIIDCGDGVLLTVNIFEELDDAEQSNAIAAQWVNEYLSPDYAIAPPEIMIGEVVVSA